MVSNYELDTEDEKINGVRIDIWKNLIHTIGNEIYKMQE